MLVLLLATCVAWGGMLPVVARIVVDAPHVCHCKASEHDCVCVRCQPDRPELWTSEESVKGQCGDDDAFPSASGVRGIVATPFVVVAAVPTGARAPALLTSPPEAPSRAPPVPPPERLRAAV